MKLTTYSGHSWKLARVPAVLLAGILAGTVSVGRLASPALAGWGGDCFVQNVGQVQGDCLYYTDTPCYRLEISATELRVWLKDEEERSGLKGQDTQGASRRLRLLGYFLRVPLATGSGQATVQAEDLLPCELRVIRGGLSCRRAVTSRRLVIQSPEENEGLALEARTTGVVFKRLLLEETANSNPAPWLAVGIDPLAAQPLERQYSELAVYSPISADKVTGELIKANMALGDDAQGDWRVPAQAAPVLRWSTFIGGESQDYVRRVAGATDGGIVVAGNTASLAYPTTPGAYDSVITEGHSDGYVSKLSSDGSYLMWSTLLGGSDDDHLDGMTIAEDGGIVVTGMTRSGDYPTTPGAYDEIENGEWPYDDIYITKLSASGDNIIWSGVDPVSRTPCYHRSEGSPRCRSNAPSTRPSTAAAWSSSPVPAAPSRA